MSYQDPYQSGQNAGYNQYGGNPNPEQPPQSTDPYSNQQQGGYQGGNPQYGQPGPGQQGYGQPQYGQSGQYGQPQYQSGQPSTTSMKPNTAAGVSYILGWITGLIIFFQEKQNRFVRFNAMQSIIYSGIATIYSLIISPLIDGVFSYNFVASGINDIIGLVLFVGWIFCMINAFQGKYFKLPYIGDLAEKYANSGTPGTPGTPGTF